MYSIYYCTFCIYICFFIFFFFFSSRRRHTRFDCDWSSDVCSSDLAGLIYALYQTTVWFLQGFTAGLIAFTAAVMGGIGNLRSEEHTSELQSQSNLVCRLLLEKKKKK